LTARPQQSKRLKKTPQVVEEIEYKAATWNAVGMRLENLTSELREAHAVEGRITGDFVDDLRMRGLRI
jgi:hypothetical protein